MHGPRQRDIQRFEGTTVNVALSDGSVLDRVALVLARRGSVWVVAGGEDTFYPLDRVVDVWPAGSGRRMALASNL